MANTTKQKRSMLRNKKFWIVVIIIVVLSGAGALAWYLIYPQLESKPDPVKRTPEEQQSYNNAVDLAQTQVDDPIVKANELAAAAYYYAEAGAHEKSLETYLRAQQIVDNNNLNKNSLRYYRLIAQQYRDLGQKSRANEYYNKEIEYLKSQESVDQSRIDAVKKEKAS